MASKLLGIWKADMVRHGHRHGKFQSTLLYLQQHLLPDPNVDLLIHLQAQVQWIYSLNAIDQKVLYIRLRNLIQSHRN